MKLLRFLRVLIAVVLCTLAFAPGAGTAVSSAGGAPLHLTAERPRLDPLGDEDAVIPSIPGFGATSRPGEPMLPLRVLLVAIPEGSVPELQIVSQHSEPLGTMRVAPVPHLRVEERLDRPSGAARPQKGNGARSPDGAGLQRSRNDFEADQARYDRDAEFPDQPVRLGRIGYLRQQRYVEVLYMPVLYNPARREARFVSEVDATVIFTPSETGLVLPSQPFEPDQYFEDTYSTSLVNYEQGKLFRAAAVGAGEVASTQAVSTTLATGAPSYKIAVSHLGIYRLDYAYLQLNAPEALAVDPRTFILSAEGVEVPISIRDATGGSPEATGRLLAPGDFVEFIGRPKTEPPTILNFDSPGVFPDIFQANDFTDTQVYWLTWGGSPGSHARIPSASGAPGTGGFPIASNFEDAAVWDENNLYLPLDGADPFFSIPSLVAASSQETRDISLPLPGLAPVAATTNVEVRLRGGSDITASNPDHRTRVWVNSDTAGGADYTWDAEVINTTSFSEAQANLSNPTTIHFHAPGLSGVSFDKQYLDTVTIRYRRQFTATGDFLRFAYPNQDTRFQVGGFSLSPPAIYEVTRTLTGSQEIDPVLITGASVSGVSSLTYTFDMPHDPSSPASAVRTFLLAGPPGISRPDGITRAADPALRIPTNAADLIVIGTRTGIDASQNGALDLLLSYRASPAQGLTSKVVYIDQVYDEFSFGLRDPNAIRSFLSYAYDNWKGASGNARPPSFVLLVGDANPDYKGIIPNADRVDQVPTAMMFVHSSILGYYSSDNWLASFRGTDQIPDVHIGRITTRDATKSAQVFDKIRHYEQSPPPGSWKGRALLLATEGKFPTESDGFEFIQNDLAATYFATPPYSATKLYFAQAPWNGVDAALFKNDIINNLQSGAAVLSLVGHGSFETWGLTTFFTTTDAQFLNNGPLPFMVNINCLAGGFHFLQPGGSLGEAMTNNAAGGSIATLAPSGLSDTDVAAQVTDTLFGTLFGIHRQRILGEGDMALRMALWGEGKIIDLQSYTFLGDPATRLTTPAPPAPVGLAAVAGNGQVDLSWSAPATPVAGYRIFRAASSAAGSYAPVVCDPVTATSCVDRTVINATTYYYYAVSVDVDGFAGAGSNDNSDCDSGPGCVLARPINPGPPSVPQGLAAQDPGTGGTLRILWQANTERDIKTYTFYYGTAPGNSQPAQYPFKLVSAATTTSFLLPGLTDGTRYYMALSATNTSGHESALTPEISGVPHLIQGIGPPRSITDLLVTRSGSNLVLTWSQPTVDIYGRPTIVVSYNVYGAPTPNYIPGPANLLGILTGGSNTTFTHSGAALSPGNFYYIVTAVDINGFVSGGGRDLPNGIQNLSVGLVSSNPLVVRLTWPAVVNDTLGFPTLIDHYQVHRTSVPVGRATLNNSTIFRDGVHALTVDLDVTGLAGPSFFTVLAVDDRGNLSPF